MAEDDIYGNKRYYKRFKQVISYIHLKPHQRPTEISGRRKAKYYCRNQANVAYLRQLVGHLEAKDLSYIHRLRMLRDLLFICYHTTKDLS